MTDKPKESRLRWDQPALLELVRAGPGLPFPADHMQPTKERAAVWLRQALSRRADCVGRRTGQTGAGGQAYRGAEEGGALVQ